MRGSDRREWWRVGLTAVGAGLATGLGQVGAALYSLRGRHHIPYAAGLFDDPGERRGTIFVLGLLLIPVLAFLGQCARIGAVHRDRRLAGLRLAGAGAAQVRRIAALETGPACLLGAGAASAVCVSVLASIWKGATLYTWTGMAVVAVAVPLLGAGAGVFALRHVVASPLGLVRRVRPEGRGGMFAVGTVAVVLSLTFVVLTGDIRASLLPPLAVLLVAVAGAGAVATAGTLARLAGGFLAPRARSAAVLIAAERLRDDPWAAARTHAAVLLITVIGTGYVAVRAVLVDGFGEHRYAADDDFYLAGLDLTAAAIGLALLIALSGLAVGSAESLASRRRGLAAQVAAGVPRSVLARALLLETALPLAPAVLFAGGGGALLGYWYGELTDVPLPYSMVLVPLGVYGTCLLAAATSLPLLGRTVRPEELRQA
ncbi:ABC transporter permease [Streptomyces roseirectus]|uniref:ABC transporter permease n=1 Tax=Streptomyces roseirectus TaxID=2768066 RepID=A0A7H0IT42_9ACTN|nr:ABC transporter permease [Streptomyces roseirectus]QNP75958.1 ABC transporter permease [Streptomyces roseirectus]